MSTKITPAFRLVVVLSALAVAGGCATQAGTDTNAAETPAATVAEAPASPTSTEVPAEESSATPDASADAPESMSASYKVGDRIRVGDSYYLTVDKVETYKGSGSIQAKPKAGNTILAVLVTLEGIDPDGASYNLLYAGASDADGYSYTLQIFPAKDPTLKSGELAPGKKAKGWVTIEIPKRGPVSFVYKPLLGDATEVSIRAK